MSAERSPRPAPLASTRTAPTGFRESRSGGEWTARIDLFGKANIVPAVLGIPLCLFLGAPIAFRFLPVDAHGKVLASPWLFLVPVAPALYFLIAALFGSQEVTVSGGLLRVRTNPYPVRPPRSIALAEVSRFLVGSTSVAAEGKGRSATPIFRYTLYGVTAGDRKVSLVTLIPKRDLAVWLLKRLGEETRKPTSS